MKKYEMLKRPLIPLLLSYMGGIWIGHLGLPLKAPHLLWLTLFIILLLFLSLFLSNRIRLVSFLVLFFSAGIILVQSKDQHSEMVPLSEKGERVVIEGTVREQTKLSTDVGRFVLRTDKVFVNGIEREVKGFIQVNIYEHIKAIPPGERIRFPARLRPFKNFNNPGRYDYERAMKLRGISCAASISDGRRVVHLGKGHLGFPLDVIEKVRRPIRHLFREHLSQRNGALFQALILGERQSIDSELRESFNRTGLGHVLAVSGLHIGLVAWLAFTLSKGFLSLSYQLTLRTDIKKLAAIITILPVVAYTMLAGFHISSQRAMIMVLAYLFSIIIGREKELWSTLFLAAFLILSVNPNALFTMSFQLSFCAVLGILWLTPLFYEKIPLHEKRAGVGQTITRSLFLYFLGLVVVTLSAVIFLLPIVGLYFHRLPLVSIPANLTVVPILGLWVIPMGFLSAITLPIPFLADFFITLGDWGLDIMMGIINFWSRLPKASIWIVTPSLVEVILFYGVLFVIFSLKRRPWKKVALILVLLFFALDVSYWIYRTRFNPSLTVTYLDVGQGNAALIQFPGNQRMLIDGGGFGRNTFDVGRMVIAPYLFRSKILRIDYLVLTHPQSDHMNGLHFIASNFRPKEFWHNGDRVEHQSFQDLMKILDERKIKKIQPADWNGERVISGVQIELLHPLSRDRTYDPLKKDMDLNDNSLVLKFSYGGISFLFPGDLEEAGEDLVISSSGPRLKSDILLAPHHGGRHSSSKTFLERVEPDICVISSGRSNPFSLPHPDTLQRLEDIGCRTIRIDQMGAVQISVRPDGIKVRTYLGGDMSD